MSDDLLTLSTTIVSAFVSNNSVPATEMAALLGSVHESMRKARIGIIEPEEEPKPEPRMPWKKTITREYLISLEDGKHYRTMKRHITKLGMTPDSYREKWSLPKDYPMTCLAYSERRSALAKEFDLGRLRSKKRAEESAAKIEPAKIEETAPKKTVKKAEAAPARVRAHPKAEQTRRKRTKEQPEAARQEELAAA